MQEKTEKAPVKKKSYVGGVLAVRFSDEKKAEFHKMLKDSNSTLGMVIRDLWDKWNEGKLNIRDGKLVLPDVSDIEKYRTQAKESKIKLEALEEENAACKADIVRLKERIEEIIKSRSHVDKSVLEGIDRIAEIENYKLEEILSDLRNKLESGGILIAEDGLVVGEVDLCPFNWRVIVEACDDMNIGYDRACEKWREHIYAGI